MLSESREVEVNTLYKNIQGYYAGGGSGHQSPLKLAVQSLESMINEGWVTGRYDKKKPLLTIDRPEDNDYIHSNED
jgi:hypothetical protein